MPSYFTTTNEYFLLSSAAYADLWNDEGKEQPIGNRVDEQGDAAYEELKRAGWRLIHAAKGRHGYRGYVFVHEQRRELCVAHRGTQNLGSMVTDILAVVGETRTGHAIDAVKETLGVPVVQQYLSRKDWILSTTGHSLGGWLAALLQYVVTDLGMGFHFKGEVVGRVFDAPGIGAFLNQLQSRDDAQQVDIGRLDHVNYVVRADIVNTLNEQIGTMVCIEGDAAAQPRPISDLPHLVAIHSRANIQKALAAGNFQLIQRWPETSSDVLAKVLSALQGSKLSLLKLAAGVAQSAVQSAVKMISGLLSTLPQSEAGSANLPSDAEIEAARESFEKAMNENLRILPYGYHQERQIRHLPMRIGLFLKAYQQFKSFSATDYLLKDEDKLSDDEMQLLNSISIEHRAQADWVVFRPQDGSGIETIDQWLEAFAELAQRKTELLEFSERVWSYYDGATKVVEQLKARSLLTGERLQQIARELEQLKLNKAQSAVIRIGCALATGEGAYAQALWSLSADDLEKIEKRAERRALRKRISNNLFGAEAYGKNAVAFSQITLIPSGIKTESGLLQALQMNLNAASEARREFREDLRRGDIGASSHFGGGASGAEAEAAAAAVNSPSLAGSAAKFGLMKVTQNKAVGDNNSRPAAQGGAAEPPGEPAVPGGPGSH